MSRRAAFLLAAAVAVAGFPAPASAMVFPVSRAEYDVASYGQLTVVIVEREAGRMHLIPNLRLRGTGYDFTLLVPVPSVPSVEWDNDSLWPQILDLTGPFRTRRDNYGCAHAGTEPVIGYNDDAVLTRASVDGFRIKIMAPDPENPRTVTQWLAANGFAVAPQDSAVINAYSASGWSFCTLRMDPSQMSGRYWDTNVRPLRVTFEARELEIPLPLLGINNARPSMEFLVVDDHRADIPGFTTTYANRISAGELAAMTGYPQVLPYLAPGRFLTRLERTFTTADDLRHPVLLRRAPDDREYRRVVQDAAWSSFPAGLLALGVAMLAGRALHRRVKTR